MVTELPSPGAGFRITVFSDFSCPYSFLAESLLHAVAPGEVELAMRAFELYPEPEELPPPRITAEERGALHELARGSAITLTEPDFRPRTRKAHEAARFARAQGVEYEMRRGIFTAYHVEDRDIGRIDVLVEIAGSAGVDPEELRIALDIDRFRDDVLHDEEIAGRLGIQSTPTTFIGSGPSAKIVVGAMAASELKRLLESRISERAEKPSDG